ncbi:hypothetical protein AHF37_08783 [Paragonimus kellicotti]|nr:hypothetical protein AHF37_08783 [Paragonimus kellicotti]
MFISSEIEQSFNRVRLPVLGESLDPRSTSTRILITGHWIFVVIMVSMFSANLSARLTVSGLKEEIKSLEQLVEQTDVKYTVQSNSAEYAFFRKMYEVEESLFKVWRELSVNLKLPFASFRILRLKAENTLDILEKKWWSTNASNCPETTSTTGFGMEQVGGMFILLACGFVAGVIILGIELLVYRLIMKRAANKVGDSTANPGFDDKETKSTTATAIQKHQGHENNPTVLTSTATAIVISTVELESPPPPSYDQSQS